MIPPPAIAAADPDPRAGFTLLEMLVTLVIVGLVIAVTTAAMARRDMTPTPLQAAKQLQSVFLRARSDAIRTGGDTAVLVDAGGRKFAYPADAEAVALPDRLTLTMLGGAEFGVGKDTAYVVFRADGSSSGAEIELADGARAARIEINWLTGVPRLREAALR